MNEPTHHVSHRQVVTMLSAMQVRHNCLHQTHLIASAKSTYSFKGSANLSLTLTQHQLQSQQQVQAQFSGSSHQPHSSAMTAPLLTVLLPPVPFLQRRWRCSTDFRTGSKATTYLSRSSPIPCSTPPIMFSLVLQSLDDGLAVFRTHG